MKGRSTFPQTPGLWPHNQIQFRVIPTPSLFFLMVESYSSKNASSVF